MSKKNGAARVEPPVEDYKAPSRSIVFTPETLAETDAAAKLFYRGNRSFIVDEALKFFLAHLRKTRNGGKPISLPEVHPVGRRNRVR